MVNTSTGEAAHGIVFHACSPFHAGLGVSAFVILELVFSEAVFASEGVLAEALQMLTVQALRAYPRQRVPEPLCADSSCGSVGREA